MNEYISHYISISPYLTDTRHDLTECQDIEAFVLEHCETYTPEYPEDTIHPIYDKFDVITSSSAAQALILNREVKPLNWNHYKRTQIKRATGHYTQPETNN
jgi:hypothetical protein